MDIQKITAAVDHTLLNTTATWQQIQDLCDEALAYNTASVCIPPAYVAEAAQYLKGQMPVCTVIGFPNGYNTQKTKVQETQNAIEDGANEIDMVINLGLLKAGREALVQREIEAVKKACGSHILKVIVEACLLTPEEKVAVCRLITDAGADYIKTSTGFAGGGATPEDVALFARHIGPGVKIKAAGGIRSLEDAWQFLQLGASRLGTSSIVRLIKGQNIASY